MALQKTKQLHKQLDEMKPNVVFSSTVKRPTDLDTETVDSAVQRTLTTTALNSVGRNLSQNQKQVMPGNRIKQSVVERPGQDDGFLIARALANNKNQMFNSTSPRFNYEKQETVMKEIPGPGSYDSTQNATFSQGGKTQTQFNQTYSVFKDVTSRMVDLKGYRGY